MQYATYAYLALRGAVSPTCDLKGALTNADPGILEPAQEAAALQGPGGRRNRTNGRLVCRREVLLRTWL
jgi:hypothetical protein